MRRISKVNIFVLALAMAGMTFAFGQDNKEKAKEHYQKGNLYYQQGKFNEAQYEYKKALDLLTEEKPAVKTPPISSQPSQLPQTMVLPEEKAVAKAQDGREYRIGDEDELHIAVWQNQDLDIDAIVRPDGKISFPLIGDVQATGLTIPELNRSVTEKLQEYIKHPQVSISIKKMGGEKVMVLGEIGRPGVYSVNGAKTLLEAISQAGGFTRDAVPSSTIVIRGGFGKPEAKRINLSKALKGDLSQNIALKSEDIVFVPRKFISDVNYFLTQILDPVSKGFFVSQSLKGF